MRIPPHVADTARASRCGKPGPPSRPATTSSSPARERIATPFQVGSPWAATSYPRCASSPPSSSANLSSASLVSCRQTTSGRRSSSHGSSRGTRCLTEVTFQVAIRTLLPPYPACRDEGGRPRREARDEVEHPLHILVPHLAELEADDAAVVAEAQDTLAGLAVRALVPLEHLEVGQRRGDAQAPPQAAV